MKLLVLAAVLLVFVTWALNLIVPILFKETVQFYNNQDYEYKKISELLNKSSDAHVAHFRGMGVFLMPQITFG